MKPTHLESNDRCRSELCLMAACLRFCATLLRYPDQSIHNVLGVALPVFEDLHHGLVGCFQAPLPDLESMQQSYTSLFVANPAGIPAVPYISSRLEPERHVYGAATRALRALMAAEGVRTDEELGEPEDHIGCVFDFAALLAERAVETPLKLPGLHRVFSTYLSPVLPGFAAEVYRADPAGFYADAAAFCSALVGNLEDLFPVLMSGMKTEKEV